MIDSGFINVNKESDWTSFDVVAKLRNVLKVKKVGHTGTLDPMATGVLVIAFGKATKLSEKFLHSDKVYSASLLLGIKTDTLDITGDVIKKCDNLPSEDEIKTVISGFLGVQEQIPPMYSAKKVNGKKLYELARAGKTIERKPSVIKISDIIIENINIPYVEFTVFCSGGTYIRTLCDDIGEKLGCGGCMDKLTRIKVKDFDIKDSFTINEIIEMKSKGDYSFITPIEKIN